MARTSIKKQSAGDKKKLKIRKKPVSPHQRKRNELIGRGAEQVLKEQKSSEALRLRLKGYTYAQIANEMGIYPMEAHRLVKGYLDQAIEDNIELARETFKLELERLDYMLRQIHNYVDLNPSYELEAIDRMLKIQERRTKYLGLDKPAKMALTDPTGEEEYKPPVQVYIPDNGRNKD